MLSNPETDLCNATRTITTLEFCQPAHLSYFGHRLIIQTSIWVNQNLKFSGNWDLQLLCTNFVQNMNRWINISLGRQTSDMETRINLDLLLSLYIEANARFLRLYSSRQTSCPLFTREPPWLLDLKLQYSFNNRRSPPPYSINFNNPSDLWEIFIYYKH